MDEETEGPETDPGSLPANRAVVVQFRPARPDGSLSFRGRVEHIASGRAELFRSEEQLKEAFTKLLSRDPG